MNTSLKTTPERDMGIVRVTRVVAVLCLTFAVTAIGLKNGAADEATVFGVTSSDAVAAPVLAVHEATSAPRAYYMPSEYDETKASDTGEGSPTF